MWMHIVGGFYLLLFISSAIVKLPFRTLFEGVLTNAAAGDQTAKMLIDTWVMFGLEVGVIGAGLLIASRIPGQARVLVWTVLGLELVRGIIDDIYMIARGYEVTIYVGWIVIHAVIIITGILALRAHISETEPVGQGDPGVTG
ncbi:MAG: BphX family protein [Candidatus Marinimicrobia bacterium]|nr:BphX family protein [Candidatus Neomarinimicrobiota bacterium]MCF7827943.1 BphX family protein [Candidatus Neomarinimicrobiota bacterium]MCF7879302.1 BphX family protein [Candidatus Neomarinimicrobiota bacterium]